MVGITLLPTIYYLLYKNGKVGRMTKFVEKISLKGLEDSYEGGMDFFFRYRKTVMASFLGIILIMVWLFITMEKTKFPAVRQDEIVVSVDWNENIDVNENLKRIKDMTDYSGNLTLQTNSFIGEQQFLFNRDYDQSYTQARIYIKAKDYNLKDVIEKNSYEFIRKNYPAALINVAPQQNVFEKIFSASESPLIVEVSLMKEKEVPPVDQMVNIVSKLQKYRPDAGVS